MNKLAALTDRDLVEAQVPARLLHCSALTWEGEFPRVPDDATMIFIHGPVGTGKSHLAVALLRQAVESGIKPGIWEEHAYNPYAGTKTKILSGALFVDIQEAIERLKPHNDDANSYLDVLRQSVLLVFDDLGSERLTEFTLDRVSLILRHRYNEMLRTIITSNLKPSELAEREPRLASRLCSERVIKLSGKDGRL